MKGLIITAALLMLLGLAGRGDYADAAEQADYYQNMVCSGAWPDYENRGTDCG